MKIFTVSQVNKLIKDIIDNEIVLEDITVSGELSSFSITRNIAYFTLKDNDNLLSCIMFGAKQEYKIGDMVQCRGNVKYYPKGGKISFNALSIELCGQGELYQQFLQMKAKLQAEGLFDESNKIKIPQFVQSIGVVTSKTGAVLQDIKNVALRRNPNLEIFVYDAQVQGKFATEQVIEGITYFDNMTDVDVIVVARGGGSIEDLMPFNEEKLARIAYICNKPLISAVGHETDFSILDFVADLRAPTPSAAAELVTFDNNELIRFIKDLRNNMLVSINSKYEQLITNVQFAISDIERNVMSQIDDNTLFVNALISRSDNAINKQLDSTAHSINLAINTLDKLNPAKLLNSGYAVVEKGGKSISQQNTNVGDIVKIRTSDTNFEAEITKKEELC